MLVERRISEGDHCLWDALTRCLNRDIVVIGEVDASVGFGRVIRSSEEFSLQLDILGTGNVLAILPATIS
jgi:hypothetical protein